MNLRPADLTEHLKRELAPVYLVAGDEPLLVQEALDAIRAAARRRGYSEREVLDVDKSFDWSRLIEACGSLSLFAQQRIVELRMPTGAPGKDGGEQLVQLAQRPPQDVLLIVACGALDWAKRKSGWFPALEAAGVSIYAEAFGEADFERWLAARARAAGLKPDAEALHLLAERTQGNSLAAAQDIAKLALLFPNASIGIEQVREAVADSSRFDGFDLTERMLNGDAAGVVRSLSRLRAEGVEVLELLGALTWCLRQWAEVQSAFASSGGNAQRAVESVRSIPRMRQAPYLRALPRTRLPMVYGWMRQCARIDQLAKSTGGKEQAWEELLTLVLAAAGAAPGSASRSTQKTA